MPFRLNAFSFVAPPEQRAGNFQRGRPRIDAYLRSRRELSPRGDILAALLAFEHPDYSCDDAVGTLCKLTLGGIGTTGYAFPGGPHHRAAHDQDRRRLAADASLIPGGAG